MSRYAQPQLYGQVAYPPPSYTQPAVHGYHYPAPPLQMPPQMPVYHVDPNAFRRDYALRLTELNVNSRPIIQNLSMYAQEYSRWADIVAQCIEAHIRRVPTWMKLPAFYLLDAISKNVFEPYARQFASFVIPLFLETYDQVDQATRSKMEEMLLTWRTGSPTGKELFGVVPQVAIERGIWGGDSTHGANSQSRTEFHTATEQINKSMVISELEFTLGQQERALLANPYDTTSQNHIHVLQQLRKLVEAGVSQEELRQILNQLRALAQQNPAPAPPPSTSPSQSFSLPPPSTVYHASYALPNSTAYTSSVPQTTRAYPQTPYSYPSFDHENPDVSPLGTASTSLLSASTSNPPATPAANISELLNSLLRAGVVTTPSASAESATKRANAPAINPDRESFILYWKSVFAQKITLNASALAKTRPHIVRLLYDQLPVQCKQCGIRFADSQVGKKKMEVHLDMHFRQNRKASQNVGRGHSRSWYIGLEDWINDVSPVDLSGKSHPEGLRRPMNAKAAAAAEVAKRDARLRAQYVVIPPGDEAKVVSCPICKENLTAEFLEDEEDWVWKNAIMKENKVYHATCHAEAVASTNSLAARLRSEISNSRSQTPEIRSTPPLRNSPLPKALGSKRKAEDETLNVKLEPDETPPAKKFVKEPSPS